MERVGSRRGERLKTHREKDGRRPSSDERVGVPILYGDTEEVRGRQKFESQNGSGSITNGPLKHCSREAWPMEPEGNKEAGLCSRCMRVQSPKVLIKQVYSLRYLIQAGR